MPKDVYQQELDEIASRQRGNSPRFPTIAEALERRQRLRETIAARLMIAVFLIGSPLASHFDSWQLGAFVAATSFVAFTVICLVAGSRHDRSSVRQLDKAIDDFCEGR